MSETKNNFGRMQSALLGVVSALIMMLRVDSKGYTYVQEVSVLMGLMTLTIIFSEPLWNKARDWRDLFQNKWLMCSGLVVAIPMHILFGVTLSIMFDFVRTPMITMLYGMFLLLPISFILVYSSYNQIIKRRRKNE